MQTFYPQNKKTYIWLLLAKWIYYAFVFLVFYILTFAIIEKPIHWFPHIFEILAGLGNSFLCLFMVSGTHVISIAIDMENQQIIIQHKLLIFIKITKKIPFDDFEYAFNGCTNYSRTNIILRIFMPYFQSDLRILDKSPYKIFLRDTFGWTVQQVAEVANSFSMIKQPKDFDEVAPW